MFAQPFRASVRPFVQPSVVRQADGYARLFSAIPSVRPTPERKAQVNRRGSVQFEPTPKRQSAQTHRKSRAGTQQKCREQSFRRHIMLMNGSRNQRQLFHF